MERPGIEPPLCARSTNRRMYAICSHIPMDNCVTLHRRMTILWWCEPPLAFAEDVAHAADLGAYSAELFFEVFVAAVEVVDAVEDGFAIGDQGSEDERC